MRGRSKRYMEAKKSRKALSKAIESAVNVVHRAMEAHRTYTKLMPSIPRPDYPPGGVRMVGEGQDEFIGQELVFKPKTPEIYSFRQDNLEDNIARITEALENAKPNIQTIAPENEDNL